MSSGASATVAGALAIGLVAFAFRYLTISPLENDHFVMLARAQQVLDGDWPVRDFEDPGQPLFYLLTAAIASVSAHVLATNVILCITLQAVAASCTYVLARRASGSSLVGMAAAVVVIVSSPRLYNTTKVIVPVVSILLQWRYADVPDTRRLAAVAGWTAIAFLFRHDYAIYVVASTLMLIGVRHAAAPLEVTRRAAIYAALFALFVSPWLIYVQWQEGLVPYTSAAVRFVVSEGRRTAAGPPGALYYLFVLIPFAGFAVAFSRARPQASAHLASTSMLVMMMNAVFLRDVLMARFPDVIAPTVVLGAATIGPLVQTRLLRVGSLLVCGVMIVFTAMSLSVAGYRVPTPAAVFRQAGRVTTRLVDASADIQPSPRHAAIAGYVQRCTPPDGRVLVSGFGPEVPFLAHRPFAGGLPSWIPGYYDTPPDLGRARERLNREPVAAAVLLEGSRTFERSWPELASWFRTHGYQEHVAPGEGDAVRLWLPGTNRSPADPATGLPCANYQPSIAHH